MVSQSGSFITQMFEYLARMGMGFSTAISVGNEADIDMVAGLQYLAVCEHTQVITLYIETIRDPEAFIQVAKSITPRKPIVAYYVGGSESGRQASLSHTGALSGPDALYEGLFRQTGIIRASTIEEMFDISTILANKIWPQGDRVIIQTHSGGPGAVAADACDREGLAVASLPPSLKKQLADVVPHTGTVGNPLDITFSKDRLAYFSSIPDCLLSADHYDMLLVYLLMPEQMIARVLRSMAVPEDQIESETSKLIDEVADSFSRVSRAHGKPVIGFTFHGQDSAAIKFFQNRNIPVMSSPHRAARAIAAVSRYTAWRQSANI
jgi:acyl-CoA synthetase (NDP forming)